jgi:hypothetical protein
MKKNIINRRNFIGAGLAAAASVTVGKSLASEKEMINIPFKKNNEHPFNPVTYSAMPTHSLGKTGYKVGILSLGGQATLEIAGREEESEKIIHRAIDLGINYIDTAASYGKGVSQLNIGRVMKTRRNEVWLSTKSHLRRIDAAARRKPEKPANRPH